MVEEIMLSVRDHGEEGIKLELCVDETAVDYFYRNVFEIKTFLVGTISPGNYSMVDDKHTGVINA